MPITQSIVFKDIDGAANTISRQMHHTAQLLEAGADSASHLPITSLLIVAAAACAHASIVADTIKSHLVDVGHRA